MEQNFSLVTFQEQRQIAAAMHELDAINNVAGSFGLSLTGEQMIRLTERRFQALSSYRRIEFGEGVLQKLVHSFCDSPYIMQRNFEETLGELQDIFYYFKNEMENTISDDELIEAIKAVFDGKAQGSLEFLAGLELEYLYRIVRGGDNEEDVGEQDEEVHGE